MAGGGLVGLRSGLVTQAVAAPPSLPTFQMIPWCASVTYTLPAASNVNPSRPGFSPVTVMNTEEAPVFGIDGEDLRGRRNRSRVACPSAGGNEGRAASRLESGDADGPQVLALRVEHNEGSLGSCPACSLATVTT